MAINFLQIFIGLAVVGVFGATILQGDLGWHWILLAAAGAALMILAVQRGTRALLRRNTERRNRQQLWK